MKIKLPTFRLGRSAAGPTSVSPGGTLTAEPAIGGAGDQLRLLSRRVRGAAGWVAFFLAVFFVFVWVSLPTRAIAWRIGQAARDAGYIVEIEDVSLSPFGGATLYNVTWTFQPSHSGQIPRKLELAQVDVDVAVLKLLFGSYDIELDTAIDDATIHAAYTRNDSESTVKIDVDSLALYDVPKLQQAVNAPLVGLFGLHVDMTMPENQFSKATGSISMKSRSANHARNWARIRLRAIRIGRRSAWRVRSHQGVSCLWSAGAVMKPCLSSGDFAKDTLGAARNRALSRARHIRLQGIQT